jgi:protein SCO1/2
MPSLPRPLRVLLVAAVFIAGVLSGVLIVAALLPYVFAPPTPKGTLPNLGRAPVGWTLTNQLGEKVPARALAGRIVIVSFLDPFCRQDCPLIAHHYVEYEHAFELAGIASHVVLVSFDLDPKESSPAVLRAFQRNYGWNPHNTRWEFLTGTMGELRRVVTGGFHVNWYLVPKGSPEDRPPPGATPPLYSANPLAARARYDVMHPALLEVVGPHGTIRRIFNSGQLVSTPRLLAVVRRLLPPTVIRAR